MKIFTDIKAFFDISGGTDVENTVKTISEGINLKGANIWFLICSALLASIGLDLNSPAIIIGAMLISPLMGTILGIGLAIGIHDKEILISAVKEFTLAVIISLLTSSLYFLITPLGNPTSEIIARTSPTLLDVGIGFFGGIAGIVAGSRKGIATAIPGVAIATALMPPLCTAGFGIATGDYKIFLGAFYLFFINSVFISIAVYLIVKYLKFPVKEYLDKTKTRKFKRLLAAVIVILTIPSMFIFYGIIKEVRLNKKLNNFINENISVTGRNVIEWKYYEQKDTVNNLVVYVVGEKITGGKLDSLNNKLPVYDIPNTRLNVFQLSTAEAIQHTKRQIMSDVMKNFELSKTVENEKNSKIDSLQQQLDKIKQDSLTFINASNELKALYQDIIKISYSHSQITNDISNDSSKVTMMPVYEIEWNNKISNRKTKANEKPIYEFLKLRMKQDTLRISGF